MLEPKRHKKDDADSPRDAFNSDAPPPSHDGDLTRELPAWLIDALDHATSLGENGWSEKQVLEYIDKQYPAPTPEAREELHQMVRIVRAADSRTNRHTTRRHRDNEY